MIMMRARTNEFYRRCFWRRINRRWHGNRFSCILLFYRYVNVVEKKEQCWEDYMDGDYREVYCDIKIVKYVCPECSAKWSSSSKGLEKLRKRVRT